MATIAVVNAKQEKLFRLSDSERAEKVAQLIGVLDEIDYLEAEKKEFMAGHKDQMEDAKKRLANLREDLGLPESHLSEGMRAAREEERGR